MPLPTANLKLHVDASNTDDLFTTYVSGGPNTGTPSDGNEVQVWRQESDSGTTRQFRYISATSASPNFRTTTPLMLLSCLDFDGTNDIMVMQNNAGVDAAANEFMTTTAKTILVAFYAESITSTNADPYINHPIIAAAVGGRIGICLKDVSGTPKIQFTNNDGDDDILELAITANASHVAVLRHDGTNLYGSVDGGSESSIASGTTATFNGAVQLGTINIAGTARFNGRIGELAIYNAALTGQNLTDAISFFTSKWLPAAGGPALNRRLLLGVG